MFFTAPNLQYVLRGIQGQKSSIKQEMYLLLGQIVKLMTMRNTRAKSAYLHLLAKQQKEMSESHIRYLLPL